eukprot:TRINITY_DN801_c0_g1_i1.p1 TRINITY_DN801_c0_g1~~TRINITY_DN801_c0_g1_i1.p1  ORF type:complete len:142 (+),score=4.49 TRINITY_DN801_c0_g1_i1:433-858(+)
MIILSILALLHRQHLLCAKMYESTVLMDDALWLALTQYGLQVFDFISDINLTIEMLSSDKFKTNALIKFCGFASVIFILLPYCTNLFFAARIKTFLEGNAFAKSYFQHNAPIFVLLVCLCGGAHPSLCVVSSAIFGLWPLV